MGFEWSLGDGWPWWPAFLGYLSMFVFPLMVSLVDFVPAFLGKHRRAVTTELGGPTCDDFAVLIPIYGDIKYLVNIDVVAPYGKRVYLSTTDQESEQFYADLDRLHNQHGFTIVRAPLDFETTADGKRSTITPIRDEIARFAVNQMTEHYVVALDADSIPDLPFELLFGAMEEKGYEVVSTRLYPSNPDSLLARFQIIEYWLSMNLRRIIPWLVSGGCHAATVEAYASVMNRHSMFFQGNDVEVGLLAEDLGFTVGHVEYCVGTEVPDRVKPWWRQRFAWSGGEWRLAVGNLKLFPRHPFFFIYAAGIMIAMVPFRWYAVIFEPWLLPIVYVIYVLGVSLLRRQQWSWIVLLYPFYATINSLIMIPLGGYSYVRMSLKFNNWGWIRTHLKKQKHTEELPQA